MHQSALAGRSILIVENEPLIRMDIEAAFGDAGAVVMTTGSLKHALLLVEHDGLTGAVLDRDLDDGNSSQIGERLNERGIPYFIYSGHPDLRVDALLIRKPATGEALVAAMEGLVKNNV